MSGDLSQFILERRLDRMDRVLARRTDQLTIVLDQVHHQHNVAAVLRSAEAFGIQTVHLVGLDGKFSSGITQGSERWLDLIRHQSAEQAIEALEKAGYGIVVLQPDSKNSNLKSYPVQSLPFDRKLALVFGSEKNGVGEKFLASAECSAHVEMYGFVESFNISVAAAICMFCSSISGENKTRCLEELSDSRKELVKEKWMEGDLRDAKATKKALEKRD